MYIVCIFSEAGRHKCLLFDLYGILMFRIVLMKEMEVINEIFECQVCMP